MNEDVRLEPCPNHDCCCDKCEVVFVRDVYMEPPRLLLAGRCPKCGMTGPMDCNKNVAAIKWNSLPRAATDGAKDLEYHADPPKVAGWYWIRHGDDHEHETAYYVSSWEIAYMTCWDALFAGPIPRAKPITRPKHYRDARHLAGLSDDSVRLPLWENDGSVSDADKAYVRTSAQSGPVIARGTPVINDGDPMDVAGTLAREEGR